MKRKDEVKLQDYNKYTDQNVILLLETNGPIDMIIALL